jgi:hypothetical protein
VADIERAWWLKKSGHRPPLPTRRPTVEQDQLATTKAPEPRYAPNYAGNTRAANERARARKEPVPGKRLCNRCGELKDVDQFQIMNPRTRKRRPGCKACNAIWRKDRYLSSQKLERLGPVLRFILEDGDAHLGVICPDCDQPCRSGDEVVVSNAVLHHAEDHVV